MDLGLKNKLIIVSGTARGIGEGIVRVLSEEGAVVAIVAGSHVDNLRLQNELEKSGGRVFSVEAGLSEPAACEKAVEAIVRHYGRIEGLVNYAGVPDDKGLKAGNDERFMEILYDNLVQYYLMAHFAVPYLKITKGAIVNINSKTAETGQGSALPFAVAHGGRNALTREWAVELLKYNIRVNALIVSDFYRPQHEIGYAVAFLLSEKSSHTTGQLIHLKGGYVHLDSALANA